jgi:hypothetical protein
MARAMRAIQPKARASAGADGVGMGRLNESGDDELGETLS